MLNIRSERKSKENDSQYVVNIGFQQNVALTFTDLTEIKSEGKTLN
jgi:hypothetical protein